MCECVYRFTPGGRAVGLTVAPFELLTIFDIITLLLLVKTKSKSGWLVNTDSLVLFLMLYFVIGTVSTIVNLQYLSDYIYGAIILFRYLSVYLIIRNNGLEIPKTLTIFVVANIIAFLIEVIGGFTIDFRNGLFGFHYTGGMFPLLLVILSSIFIYNSIQKKKYWGIPLIFSLSELAFLLMEAKAEIVMYGLWVLLILLFSFRRNINSIVKKVLLIIIVAMLLVNAWNIIYVFNPKWVNLKDVNIVDSIQHRLDSQSMLSRKNSYEYVSKNEIKDSYQYLFGIGIGTALPPYNVRWIMQLSNGGANVPSVFHRSLIFRKYGINIKMYSFFASGYSCLRIETGFFGILVIFVILIICFYRSISILKYGVSMQSKILGSVGIWQIANFAYRIYNSNIVIEYLPMIVTFALFGFVSREYFTQKLRC
jgi:hypothetical protein